MQRIIKNININNIKPSPFAVRLPEDVNSPEFEELVYSAKKHGFIELITVRKIKNYYQVIAGARRLKAAKKANFTKMLCKVIDADDHKARVYSLIENGQRKDLTDYEKSISFKNIYEKLGYSMEIATRNIKSYENYLNKKTPMDIPDDFIDIADDIGYKLGVQYTFLRIAKDLTPSVLKYTDKINLPAAKKILLTRPEIRKDPHLQRTVANMIKPLKPKEASSLVHNIERGHYKFTGKEFKVKGEHEDFTLTPHEFSDESRLTLLRTSNVLNDLGFLITGEQHSRYSTEIKNRTANYRLEIVKQLKNSDLNNLYNSIDPLVDVLNDYLDMIDKEIITREKQKKILTK